MLTFLLQAEKPVEKAEKDSKNEEKENIENKDIIEKEENSMRPAPSKKPPAKVETKSFGKKDKEDEVDRKRKRIQVLNDSEEEDEEEEEKEVEEKIDEPPPPQAALLQSDSEDEEVNSYTVIHLSSNLP